MISLPPQMIFSEFHLQPKTHVFHSFLIICLHPDLYHFLPLDPPPPGQVFNTNDLLYLLHFVECSQTTPSDPLHFLLGVVSLFRFLPTPLLISVSS